MHPSNDDVETFYVVSIREVPTRVDGTVKDILAARSKLEHAEDFETVRSIVDEYDVELTPLDDGIDDEPAPVSRGVAPTGRRGERR